MFRQKKSKAKVEAKQFYNSHEPSKVHAAKKMIFTWVAWLLPVLIFIMYVVAYMMLLPDACGKTINEMQQVINNPQDLIDMLQNQNVVFLPMYENWGIKILTGLFWGGFIASLFNLGRIIHNKKPEYNIHALMREKEPYLKAMEINEAIKTTRCKETSDAKIAITKVMEKLRYESPFGYGNDTVIHCENDIVNCLKKIEGNVQALLNDKTAKEAGNAIVANCETIKTKLKIRTEMKKR